MEYLLWRYIGHVGFMDESRHASGHSLYGLDKMRCDIHDEIVETIKHYLKIGEKPTLSDERIREVINPILHDIDEHFKDAKYMVKRIWEAIEATQSEQEGG